MCGGCAGRNGRTRRGRRAQRGAADVYGGRGGAYCAYRVDYALHEQHRKGQKQRGGEEFAYYVNNGTGPYGEYEHRAEEQRAEKPWAAFGEQRQHAHFKRGGACARYAEQRPYAQHGNRGHHSRSGLGKPPEHAPYRAVVAYHGKHGHNGKAGIGYHKAQEALEPFLTGYHAKVRRENKVARAEEYGEHGEADNNNIL